MLEPQYHVCSATVMMMRVVRNLLTGVVRDLLMGLLGEALAVVVFRNVVFGLLSAAVVVCCD